MDQIKSRDINLMTIYLIFHQHLNFIATHVDARSWNADFSTIFGRKQPMRGDLANSILKAKIEIKQIGVFKKSFFLNMVVFGLGLFVFWSWLRIWTRKFEFPKFLIFFFLNHTVHYTRACMPWRGESMKFHHFWPKKAI